MTPKVEDEIAAYMQVLGLGTVGTDIFKGTMPAGKTLVCCVSEYPGAPPSGGFGVAGTVYEHPSIQIVWRGAPDDTDTPYTKAYATYRALFAVAPGTLPGVIPATSIYQMIVPNSTPARTMKDANLCHYYTVNYRVDKEP